MNIMTKRGSLDNVVTFEHICDTTADLDNIPREQITLGSVAVVLQGSAGLEFYMASSAKEWILISGGSSSDSNNEDTENSTPADQG